MVKNVNDVCLAFNEEKSLEYEKKPGSVKRPLVRTTEITTFTIRLYRLMIVVRLFIFMLFFKWRISTGLVMMSSTDADADTNSRVAAMWTVSIAGELWFALMWLLDQLPKMKPVRRAVDMAALEESILPAIDVFVSTADPEKEPPLTTANTVLSILAADYPAEKLTCYVSDDGGAPLIREAITVAAQFAGLWVPFCRKHGVEPRNPEAYFSSSGATGVDGKKAAKVVRRGDYKGRAWSELARDRRRVRREYEELRLRVNALQAAGDNGRSRCWRRGTVEDHAGLVQVVIGPSSGCVPQIGTLADRSNLLDLSSVDVQLPALVYVCREKRRGRAHHGKAGALNALLRASAVLSNAPFFVNLDCDHYVNNSRALSAGVCNMLDGRGDGDDIAFVQFPQRFDGVDPADRYANHNRVFFDCTQPGLDGLQGPIYVGTGCMFRRAALYGIDPPRWRMPAHGDHGDDAAAKDDGVNELLGDSVPFLSSVRSALEQPDEGQCNTTTCAFDDSAVSRATSVVWCGYEDRTAWGRDVGWMYGTVTEDVATGFCLHRRGWRSACCATVPDAFRGAAPLNLTDRLHQVLRWAAGSLEIFFSRNNALLAGRRLHPLQRLAYLNTTVYPFTSIFVMLYCFFPVVRLVTMEMDWPPSPAYIAFLAVLLATLAAVAVLEVRWSGIALGDWWRNEQFWMVSATSAYLAAVAQVALKVAAGKQLSFKLTSKQHVVTGSACGKDKFAELYAVRWTLLMVPPAMVLAVNVTSMVVGIEGGRSRNGATTALGVVFNAWVVVHLYPFALGLMGRWSKTWSPILLIVAWLTIRFLCFVLNFHSFKF